MIRTFQQTLVNSELLLRLCFFLNICNYDVTWTATQFSSNTDVTSFCAHKSALPCRPHILASVINFLPFIWVQYLHVAETIIPSSTLYVKSAASGHFNNVSYPCCFNEVEKEKKWEVKMQWKNIGNFPLFRFE